MKVLHVTPYIDARYGGPPVAISQIIRASTALDIRCDVATVAIQQQTYSSVVESAVTDNSGQIFTFAAKHPRSWFYSPAMGSWLGEHVKNYDLLHIHVPFTYPVWAAANYASRWHKHFVMMPHGLLDPWSLSQKRLKKIIYYHLTEQSALKRCSGINVTSVLEKEGVAKLGFGNKTALTHLSGEQNADLNRPFMRGGSLRLLFLSRLHQVKDVPTILNALRLLVNDGHNIFLDIVGDGEPQYVNYIRRLIEQLNIQKYVTMHGFLDGESKMKAYENADLFVLPSLHENFGLAVLEAMAASLPVIISDQVGLAQEIDRAGAGLIIPCRNVCSLTKAIMKFYGNVKFWKQTSVFAYNLVDQVYSRKQLGQSIQFFYKRALNLDVNNC